MEKKSFFEFEVSPFKQAALILILAAIMMAFSEFLPKVPYSKSESYQAWVIMCGLTLFFAVGNCVLSLSVKNGNIYWLHSIISYALILVIGGLMAWGFSGVTINDAGSVRWIYTVFTFGYLILLSIVNLMKFLIKLAQRQDQNI